MFQIIGRVRIRGEPPLPSETNLEHIATSKWCETYKSM